MDAKTKALIGFGAVVGLALVLYAAKKAIPPNAFNPLHADNLAHRAATELTEALTGKPGGPGIALHRWLNPDYENWTPSTASPPWLPPVDIRIGTPPWNPDPEQSPFGYGA